MTDRAQWSFVVGGCALLLAVVLQVPQLLYSMQPASHGVLVHLNSDEYQYLARVEEVLTGRPEQAAQPYVGDPYVSGMHFALIEQAEGLLFRRTGWRAATVAQVMDSVIPCLLFLVLFAFFRLAGFSRPRSLAGVFLFVLPLLYSLNRPIHQRESFLLVLVTLLLLITAVERKNVFAALGGGVMLGVLFGVYLWAWMFAWIYAALLLLWELVMWWSRRRSVPLLRSRVGALVLALCVGVIVAVSFLLSILRSMRNPLYAEMAFRQGMHFTHLPESWIYSVLFLLMSVVLLCAHRKYAELQGAKRYAILFPVAVVIAINQQIVHGQVIAFTSHFTFAIALASVCVFLLSTQRFRPVLLLTLGASALMIAAITWDNRPVLTQFAIRPSRFSEQHFATLLPVLDRMPRTRILSDSETSAFISSSTQHDIVMSIYLESAFLTHEEIAERVCLGFLPIAPAERRIGEQMHLVWPDADAANRSTALTAGRGTDVREREVRMVQEACQKLDRDPAGALQKYGVQYVLWDERRHPEWDVRRLKVPLVKVGEDQGNWVLYRIEQ
ncbi:MAG: hypothetical protein PHX87_02140 [Candidatus Peribacteraceae bacterium]|nr:hypothetical protein [Candidatus Peribacteraceae bacterium]MDD5742207.1 hypothetical protein [Candidatus Peribacteraceae bacterium]